MPLGPQNTFVLTQGAAHSRYRAVLPVVLTAALSDTALITTAVLGVSLVILALPILQTLLTLVGVGFLVVMGYHNWRDMPNGADPEGSTSAAWPLRRRIRYSLSVSLLNPHAIMDTVVVIGSGAALYAHASEKLSYALGAALVSWVWFFGLSLAGRQIGRWGRRARSLSIMNKASALIMWVIAAKYLWQLIQIAMGS
nr:LysE family transporter [Sulfobacillus harzensis]